MTERTAVYLGVDIGKASHYAVAVDETGTVIYRAAIANEEAALRGLVAWAHEHQAMVVVDQPGGIAALVLQLGWDAGVPVGYLHGLAMARARDFYPGEGKSDPKDAFVLADVARAHPSRVVALTPTPADRARLALLVGHDADLRADANRLTNRLRALMSTYWPELERALGDRLATPSVLALLIKYPSGPALQQAGRARLSRRLRGARGRRTDELAEVLVTAASAQTVVIPGAETAAELVAELAAQLAQVLARRATLEEAIETAFFALPEAPILHSLPGIGPRLGATLAVEIGDLTRFPTAAKLAAYAGLGPAPHQSGTSLSGNRATRRGNHRLKNACFLGAFASLRHPPSRTSYDRKRAEGKSHTQALLCLARRRIEVLHTCLTRHTPYTLKASSSPSPVAA